MQSCCEFATLRYCHADHNDDRVDLEPGATWLVGSDGARI